MGHPRAVASGITCAPCAGSAIVNAQGGPSEVPSAVTLGSSVGHFAATRAPTLALAASGSHCRVGWTRHILNGVRSLPTPLAERVRAAIPAAHRRQVEESIALRWLPFEVHMSVLGTLRSTLGALAYRRLCRAQISLSLRTPALFAKPAQAALRLYGKAPFSPFRAVDVSLRYIFRDAGQFRVLRFDDRELDVCYQDFPPRFSEGDTWSLIWLATIDALADYALEGRHLRAHAELTRHDPKRGYFEWRAYTFPTLTEQRPDPRK